MMELDRAESSTPPMPPERTIEQRSRRQYHWKSPRKNPTGRETLVFDYVLTIGEQTSVLLAVERVLKHYFVAIGGFQRVRNDLVRIVQRVLAECGEPEICWAIDAKAKTLMPQPGQDARFKRQFRGSVESFFQQRYQQYLPDLPTTSERQPTNVAPWFQRMLDQYADARHRQRSAGFELDLDKGGSVQAAKVSHRGRTEAFEDLAQYCRQRDGWVNAIEQTTPPLLYQFISGQTRWARDEFLRRCSIDPSDMRVDPVRRLWIALEISARHAAIWGATTG